MCIAAEQGSNSNSDRRESPSIMTATRMLEPFSSTFRSQKMVQVQPTATNRG